jgi:hypothetical protein
MNFNICRLYSSPNEARRRAISFLNLQILPSILYDNLRTTRYKKYLRALSPQANYVEIYNK